MLNFLKCSFNFTWGSVYGKQYILRYCTDLQERNLKSIYWEFELIV